EAVSLRGTAPEAGGTAADRVQDFATFATTHSHFLHANPEEFLPLARNQAATGFLAERTAARAEALPRPWVAPDARPPAAPRRPAGRRPPAGRCACASPAATPPRSPRWPWAPTAGSPSPPATTARCASGTSPRASACGR